MKKMILFIFALLACHAGYAQYFCTIEGAELHYVNYDEAGQSVSNETAVVGYVGRDGNNLSAAYVNKIVTNKLKGNTRRFVWKIWCSDRISTPIPTLPNTIPRHVQPCKRN